MHKTAIIIPCYNEANRLRVNEFKRFIEENKTIHFIFVDDCSSDGTEVIIDEICLLSVRQIQKVKLSRNRGKAQAVRAGFIKAFEENYEYIGYWDADLSTPLSAIKDFCAILESQNINIVMGSRVQLINHNIQRGLFRHYLGRLFATMASFILGATVYDTQCGAKIFRNNTSLQQVFGKSFTVNWAFDVEILARFIMLGKNNSLPELHDSVVEFPLKEWKDVAGSKVTILGAAISIMELIKIYYIMHSPQTSSHFLSRS